MAIANGSMSFTTEQFTSTYKVVDGSVAWNIPGEPAARFMFPHTQTLIKEVTCVMRSGAGEVKKYTIYDQYSGYTIPVRQGEITNMNVKFLPKDASISSAVDVNSWDSNTTIVLLYFAAWSWSTRDVRPANSSENQWLVTFGRSA